MATRMAARKEAGAEMVDWEAFAGVGVSVEDSEVAARTMDMPAMLEAAAVTMDMPAMLEAAAMLESAAVLEAAATAVAPLAAAAALETVAAFVETVGCVPGPKSGRE